MEETHYLRNKTDEQILGVVLEYEYELINRVGLETYELYTFLIEHLHSEDLPKWSYSNWTFDWSNSRMGQKEFDAYFERVNALLETRNKSRYDKYLKIRGKYSQ